jgi:hypothetical protein
MSLNWMFLCDGSSDISHISEIGFEPVQDTVQKQAFKMIVKDMQVPWQCKIFLSAE